MIPLMYLFYLTVFNIPRTLDLLSRHIGIDNLPALASLFIHNQLHPESALDTHEDPPPEIKVTKPVAVFPSAISTYYAPSDMSGVEGMHRERICTSSSWRSGPARYDCIFVAKDRSLPGFRGLHAARVRLFLSFQFQGVTYPCALVEWFSPIGDEPDDLTGLWMVKPDFERNGSRSRELIHIDTIVRGAHLIGAYGPSFLPRNIRFSDSLDAFNAFYVNKYADHHAHEIAF